MITWDALFAAEKGWSSGLQNPPDVIPHRSCTAEELIPGTNLKEIWNPTSGPNEGAAVYALDVPDMNFEQLDDNLRSQWTTISFASYLSALTHIMLLQAASSSRPIIRMDHLFLRWSTHYTILQAPMPSMAENGIGSVETKGMSRGVARVSAVRQSDMGSFLDGNKAKSFQVSFKTCLESHTCQYFLSETQWNRLRCAHKLVQRHVWFSQGGLERNRIVSHMPVSLSLRMYFKRACTPSMKGSRKMWMM